MKRILSFTIALLLVLSSFTTMAAPVAITDSLIDEIFKFDVGDFSAGSVTDTNSSEVKTMEFLQLIGIWDDVINKDALISMTDFSVIMARTKLGVDNAFEGVYEFEANADNKNATYRDAYIYIIDALGYRHNMSMYKDEAQGALIVADQLDLISENPENIDSFITRGELAKLINKALVTNMCVMEYNDYGYSYEEKEGECLLNKVHGIYNVSGFVNAIPGLSVFGSANMAEGFIQIDRDNIRTDGKDYTKYLGRMVKAYAKYDEALKQNTIIYMDFLPESKAFEVDFSQINTINSQYIYYMNGETEEEFNVNNLKYITENGTPISELKDISDYRNSEGKIIFTESKKYGDIDTAVVYKYEYFVVDYNSLFENKIGLKFRQKYKGEEYILIDDNARNVVYIDGVLSDYKNIAVNQAIRVMNCPSTDYTEFNVVSKHISGEVTQMVDNMVTIGGKEYRISNALLKHISDVKDDLAIPYDDKVKEIMLGTNGQFYVFDNVITNYQGASEYLYGYLKSVSMDRTSIEPEPTLRIFTQNAEWIDFRLRDKFELDGVSGSTKEMLIDRINQYYGTGDTDIVNNLVRFKANGDNVIIALDTIYEDSQETESDDDLKKDYSYTGPMHWSRKYFVLHEPYFVDNNTIIFAVPDKKEKEDNYKVTKISSIPTDGPIFDIGLYSLDPLKHARAAVFCGSFTGAATSSGSRAYYMSIEKITSVLIDEETGEKGYKVSGKQFVNLMSLGQGKLEDTFFYVKEDTFKIAPLKVGDNLKAERDGKNFATTYEVRVPDGIVPSVDEFTTVSDGEGVHKHLVGTIKAIDVERYLVLIEVDGKEYVCDTTALGIVNTTTKKITEATLSDFHPGDRVVAKLGYTTASYMFKNVQ